MQKTDQKAPRVAGASLKARVVFIKPTTLAAVHVTGPYSQSVHKAWGKIFEWMDLTKPDPIPDTGYGFFYNDPREVDAGELRYSACVRIPNNWDTCNDGSLEPIRFDGGTFLRSKVVGPYTNTGHVISDLRDRWVPKNGLVLDAGKPIFAIYHSDARYVDPDEQITEVCLPVFADRRKEPRE